jgi:hypothetical protein
VTNRSRAVACWLFLVITGFLSGFSPVLRGVDLNDPHIVAHIITGSSVIALALSQILSTRGAAGRSVDFLLVAFGLWFAVLPWIVPDTPGVGAAGEYHDHVHVLLGSLQGGAALWNVLSTAPDEASA